MGWGKFFWGGVQQSHLAKAKSVRHYHVPSLIQGGYNSDLTTGDDNPHVEPDMNIDY